MPHPLDKATADGHNVDGGLKDIGLTDQSETPSFGANPLGFVSTKLSSVWMLGPVPSAARVHPISLSPKVFLILDEHSLSSIHSQLASRTATAHVPRSASSRPGSDQLARLQLQLVPARTNTASAPSILSLHPGQLQLAFSDQPARDPTTISPRDFNSSSFQRMSVRGSLGGLVSTICKQKVLRT
ncbi:hypothetical protein F2Q69_00013954 [Brassica cretica]|uniref:Uncharacterized protein n=1 Tax=Brassica cretica TaxID=69181 RepID=A0A8S9R7I9_BRACR|nr:hypothetical protein F2Q69_00013954 [Brassica cretica]